MSGLQALRIAFAAALWAPADVAESKRTAAPRITSLIGICMANLRFRKQLTLYPAAVPARGTPTFLDVRACSDMVSLRQPERSCPHSMLPLRFCFWRWLLAS